MSYLTRWRGCNQQSAEGQCLTRHECHSLSYQDPASPADPSSIPSDLQPVLDSICTNGLLQSTMPVPVKQRSGR